MSKVLDKLHKMNYAYIYIVLYLCIAVPLIQPIGLGIGVGRLERITYDTVEALPAGSVVQYNTNLASWTARVTAPLIAIAEHLFRQDDIYIMFVPHQELGKTYIPRLIEACPSSEGWVYGEDYIIMSVVPDNEAPVADFAEDPWAFSPIDGILGQDISTFPIMQRIKSAWDIEICVNHGTQSYLTYVRQVTAVYGVLSIMMHGADYLAEHVAMYEAGTIAGAIDGIPAAAGYEVLLETPMEAARIMDVITLCLVWALVLMLIGNLNTIVNKRTTILSETEARGVEE